MELKLNCEEVVFWEKLSNEELLNRLNNLNEKYADEFSFDDVDVETRQELCKVFLNRYDTANLQLRCAIISLIRIISRSKCSIDALLTTELCQILFKNAGFFSDFYFQDINVLMEAQMCLINSLYNSAFARESFISSNCVGKLIERIQLFINEEIVLQHPHVLGINSLDLAADFSGRLQLFDLRIAFIITAHSVQLQELWLNNGYDALFINIVERIVPRRKLDKELIIAREASAAMRYEDCAIEAMKILCSLYSHASPEASNQSHANECIAVCKKVLLSVHKSDKGQTFVKGKMIKEGAIHLLTVAPRTRVTLLKELSASGIGSRDLVDKKFLDVLLFCLDEYLSASDSNSQLMLTSCLTVLIMCSTETPEARRYVRLKVMPPLHAEDVQRRPDIGEKLRNKLIKVMIGKMHISQLSAYFLFILCKRSVSRFNKYCGFGNAAGLLANYGLLGEINRPKKPDDSEDSETEDYKEVEGRVNAVTGFIEPERENIFANMSEEQKEYEAMKLVNAMKDLMDHGIISPAKTDENGKLRTVKHVLEIAEGHTKSRTSGESSDDD